MTSGRHAGGYPTGGPAFSRRGEAAADGAGSEIDALLARWASERPGFGQPDHEQDGEPGRGSPGRGSAAGYDESGYDGWRRGDPHGGRAVPAAPERHADYGPQPAGPPDGWSAGPEPQGGRYAERAASVARPGGRRHARPDDDLDDDLELPVRGGAEPHPSLRQPAARPPDLPFADRHPAGHWPAEHWPAESPSRGFADPEPSRGFAGPWDRVPGYGPDAAAAGRLTSFPIGPDAGSPGGPAGGVVIPGPLARTRAALMDPDPGLLTHRALFDPEPLDYPSAPTGARPGRDPFYPDHPNYGDPGYDDPRPGRHRRPGSGGKRPRPTWIKVIAWILAVSGLGGALVGGWGFYEYHHLSSNITRIDALAPNDPAIRQAAKQRNAENFLLIGSDTRAGANSKFGDVSGARSDTTILAHLSPNRDKALLISFPRDSWVDLPACQRTRGGTSQASQGMFNSAFEIGGPKCTVLTVQKLTGISVNHYVQVDFSGFQTMVDALNGVAICSTEDVFDKDSGLRLRRGNQVLRGVQALAYVRARHNLGDGSDLGRIQRQQRFLGAMIRKATGSRLLFNPIALTRFLNAATKSLTLDRTTSLRNLKSLGDQLRNLDPKRVTFLTAPIANQDYSPPGTSLRGKVLLDGVAGRRLWDSIINDKPAPAKGTTTKKPGSPTAPKITLTAAPSDVSVRVLNGVGVQGLAARTAAELTTLGFAVTNTGNAPLGATASVVRYAPNRLDAARTLAAAVPGSVLQEDNSLGRTVQLVIGSTYHGAVPVQAGETVPAPGTPRVTSTPATTRPSAPAASSSPSINAADTSCST